MRSRMLCFASVENHLYSLCLQLQKNCLLSLCSDRILQEVPFNRCEIFTPYSVGSETSVNISYCDVVKYLKTR